MALGGFDSEVAISGDGRRLASTDGAGVMHLWDLQTGLQVSETASSVVANTLVLSRDGSRIFAVGQNQGAFIWEP